MPIRSMSAVDSGISGALSPSHVRPDEEAFGVADAPRRSLSDQSFGERRHDDAPVGSRVEESSRESSEPGEDPMVWSLISQVESIYSERAQLYAATGCTSVPEVIEKIASLKESISELAGQARKRLADAHTLLDWHEEKLA